MSFPFLSAGGIHKQILIVAEKYMKTANTQRTRRFNRTTEDTKDTEKERGQKTGVGRQAKSLLSGFLPFCGTEMTLRINP
jgi:hypothetical protein